MFVSRVVSSWKIYRLHGGKSFFFLRSCHLSFVQVIMFLLSCHKYYCCLHKSPPFKSISLIPLARAEYDDSLPFSGASSIPLCSVLFPATLLHQLFFHYLILPSLFWSTPQSCFSQIQILLRILFSSILCTCPNQWIYLTLLCLL